MGPERGNLPNQAAARPPDPLGVRPLAGPAADPALIERVLRETLAASDTEQPRDRQELAALREVSRRHPAEPFGLEPVAKEMVEAILRVRFADRFHGAESRSAMAARIAETFCDDPISAERLKDLWVRLGGE